jgi:hypothetical protein
LKLGVFALIPAILLLVVAETCATFTIDRTVRTETDPQSGHVNYSLRIGRFPWRRQSITPLNSLGFPDVEFATVPPKEHCLHIVFTGDSFVFGDGVDSDSSFVGLVRSWNSARGPAQCTRVFNLGERGTTIDRQARRIRETMEALQPDIVILGQYQNDLADLDNPGAVDSVTAAPAAAGDATDVRDRFAPLNLNLVRFLSYHAFGTAIRRNIRYDVLRHWSVLADTSRRDAAQRLMGLYRQQYESLVAELAARNIDFGVIVIPSKFDVLAGRFPEEEFFVGLAEKNDVPYLRVFPILDEKRSPYTFLMYDGHLNELGNRLIAEAVQRWLHAAEPAPFPVLRTRVYPDEEATPIGES